MFSFFGARLKLSWLKARSLHRNGTSDVTKRDSSSRHVYMQTISLLEAITDDNNEWKKTFSRSSHKRKNLHKGFSSLFLSFHSVQGEWCDAISKGDVLLWLRLIRRAKDETGAGWKEKRFTCRMMQHYDNKITEGISFNSGVEWRISRSYSQGNSSCRSLVLLLSRSLRN